MANAADALLSLQIEATCVMCLRYYEDPVSTECGHTFCRTCIIQYGNRRTDFPCPQCHTRTPRRTVRPNRQLHNIVEITKQLCPQGARKPGKSVCEQHKEELVQFFEEDQKAICSKCQISTEHKSHTFVPVEEAAAKYKRKLQEWLPSLQKVKKGMVTTSQKEKDDWRVTNEMMDTEKQKMLAAYAQMHRILKDEERRQLAKLEEMHLDVSVAEKDNVDKLSKELDSLDDLISKIEDRCKQPTEKLLLDVRGILSRCENIKLKHGELAKRKGYKVKDNIFEHWKIREPKEGVNNYKVQVTLDPDTAHKELLLSEGGQRVRHTGREQNVPDHPKRFTGYYCRVLGSQGFSSGKRYWEVELLNEGSAWSVGVARESIGRSEPVTQSPSGGLWAVEGTNGHYKALTSPCAPLVLHESPRKVGVYLDWDGGQLSVYNADSLEHFYTFTNAHFSERVYPYFYLWSAEIYLL